MMLKQKAVSVLEDSIVMIVMFCIFLPMRVVFYNVVSDNWFGSFGLISAIVVALVLLSKKNKLGWFGRIYWKSITRVHKGKRRIISYFSVAIMLYLWGSMIFGINFALTDPDAIQLKIDTLNTITPEEQAAFDRINNAVNDYDLAATNNEIMKGYENIPPELIVIGLFLVFFMPVLDFVTWAVIVSLVDNMMSGWFLHFGTIFFIEALEIVGIMIYTYTQTRKNTNTT